MSTAIIASPNLAKLSEHIVALSESKNFAQSCKEWRLFRVELHDEYGMCPCGQHIKEHCFIQNTLNGNTTHVGNVCVENFIGIKTGQIFSGIHRIIESADSNANLDLLAYALAAQIINHREHVFLSDVCRKRKFTDRQASWKRSLNLKIIRGIRVSSPSSLPNTTVGAQ